MIGPQLKAQYLTHVRTQVMPRAQRQVEAFLDRDVPRKTGALARSRKITVNHSATGSSMKIVYPTKVANYTEEGTRAHVIRPRRAKALRFVIGGRTAFARRVMWRPGPGVARNKGWFSRNTGAARWRTILGQVLGR